MPINYIFLYKVFSAYTCSTMQARAKGLTWKTAMGAKNLPIEARNTASLLNFFNHITHAVNGKSTIIYSLLLSS